MRRLFEKFKGEFPTATLLTIRLIEPYIDMDGFVQTLSERLASLREQDPVLLHIDVAAVCLSHIMASTIIYYLWETINTSFLSPFCILNGFLASAGVSWLGGIPVQIAHSRMY